MKLAVACLLSLLAAVAARSAYQFSDGYLEILGGEPNQVFDCAGRSYGYYADVANDCRIFHVCVPVSNEEGEVVDMAQFSFFCGNQTVFSQESLTCAHPEEALPCTEAEGLFDVSNADFGKIPDDVAV
ncbi:U-scoloptoxin(01)-Er1a-like [Macrobrachium nipponense]|uniref:U-scoloptoxin(01)-Er1a-like n=1 Tax=Macrobrachium nipponense TaxID=159736 RepID=UPI0030C8BE61